MAWGVDGVIGLSMATDRILVAGENGNGNGIVVMDVIRVRKEQRSKDGRDDCAAVLVSGQGTYFLREKLFNALFAGSTLLERSTVLRVSAGKSWLVIPVCRGGR